MKANDPKQPACQAEALLRRILEMETTELAQQQWPGHSPGDWYLDFDWSGLQLDADELALVRSLLGE